MRTANLVLRTIAAAAAAATTTDVAIRLVATFLGLKEYFTQNTSIISNCTKLGSSFSHYGLHTLWFGLHC